MIQTEITQLGIGRRPQAQVARKFFTAGDSYLDWRARSSAGLPLIPPNVER